MMLCVSSRVVKTEKRIKVFQCLLRNLAAHFLGLVQNDNRAVCLNHIDWAAGAKLVTL